MDDSTIDKYAYRSDVDNQLGSIYQYLQYKFIPIISPEKLSDDIGMVPNFVQHNVASDVRSFITSIPYDPYTKRLNDTDNQPRDSIVKSLLGYKCLEYKIPETYQNKLCLESENSSNWDWEHYKFGIWRAVPLYAFINSPIYDLINIILWKIHISILNTVSRGLSVGTVVLQKVPKGTHISWHVDNCGTRKLSFIYYLTPDDWSKEDGGELIIKKDDGDLDIIPPKFNQLVYWWINDRHIPHKVNTVNSDKNRFALVGFFDQR